MPPDDRPITIALYRTNAGWTATAPLGRCEVAAGCKDTDIERAIAEAVEEGSFQVGTYIAKWDDHYHLEIQTYVFSVAAVRSRKVEVAP